MAGQVSFDIDNLLKGMEKSVKTVVSQRPGCRRLTFCIPFDLPDSVEAGKRKSARQKFEDRKQSWRKRIPGADQVRIDLWSEGDLLERLVQHPGRRGIARFFWDTEIFSPEWCAERIAVVREIVRKRYRPELHVDVPVSFALEGLALSENYWRRFRGAREAIVEAADQILVSRYKGLGVTEELRNLKKKLAQWQHAMPKQTTLPERLDTAALREVTRECGEPLRQTILDAPPNWVEALAVLVPERFGIELEDATRWNLDDYHRYVWDSALVNSVALRRPSAVTQRTRELLGEAQRRSPDLRDFVREAWLSVATQPEHPLNADKLHETLKGMSMPDRDEVWSKSTYYALDDGGPLDRLIRWASRSRRPDCPSEVVELAAITLAWTFTSPNRQLRDQATKALAQLLSEHLTVLPSLIRKFAGVNDPYLVERLAVACHGAALCGSTSDPQAVVRAAEAMKRVVFADDQPPNFITRDAVRGIYEWCFHNGWVDEPTYSGLLPPYSSTPPEAPPTDEGTRRDYDVVHRAPGRRRPLYADIYWSVGDMGDFGRYIIQFAVHRFTPYRFDEDIPMEEQRAQFDSAWAQKWVFQRVISLGWTPERFAAFDERVNYWQVSRTAHKPERFGKKYQWIAFHELIARIADNYQMRPAYGGEIETYKGPWQLLSRDIDPTLPPPLRTRNADDEVEAGKTFPEDSDCWWVPAGPRYRDDDPPADEGWGTDSGDIPDFEPLVRCQDRSGSRWVVLHAWYNWTSGRPWRRAGHSRRREMWNHIYSWLVRPEQREAVVGYLEQRTLMNRWMPEGVGNTDDAYLGELPWAMTREDPEDVWQPVASRWDEESTGLEVSPAWEAYDWEGNIRDCSIDEGVRAWYPAPLLVDSAALTWRPGTREWRDPAGVTVAQFVETRDHNVLLVREDWLKRTLRRAGLNVIFGWLGEKQLLEKDGDRIGIEVVGGWTEINGVASLDGRRWRFGQRRLETRSVSNDDADISSGSDGINGTDIIRQMLRDSGYGE